MDFGMNMYYCPKVFATFLVKKGIEPEIIDPLQGRKNIKACVCEP
jgi:hypothetical protein